MKNIYSDAIFTRRSFIISGIRKSFVFLIGFFGGIMIKRIPVKAVQKSGGGKFIVTFLIARTITSTRLILRYVETKIAEGTFSFPSLI